MTTALLIPADTKQPSKIVTLGADSWREIRSHVGGDFEQAFYDRDAVVLVNENGLGLGLPWNDRASTYIREGSDAAKSGRMRHADPGYGLVGDVLMVGPEDLDGKYADVPRRLVDHFVSMEREIQPPAPGGIGL